MMNTRTRCRGALLAWAALLAAWSARSAPLPDGPPPAQAALASPLAASALMLGAARAGARSVAVGEHGIVLLSDDGAAAPRQAASVPVRSLLTAVHFIDARRGWAVGHHGVILASIDGGEHWLAQRRDTTADRPLFAVHFFDERHGVAVGLWSLVLITEDGGRHWTEQPLPAPPGGGRADANLLGLFADAQGRLYATAERGLLLRSDDRGRRWQYLSTGYTGSFWTGTALADGSLLAAGQRGSLYRSGDDGRSWQRVPLQSKSSITAIAQGGGDVRLVGLDGLVARSVDGARSFQPAVRQDGLPLTALLFRPGRGWQLWSRQGLVPDGAAAPK
jgi:photosystem II stability/assembly factor-like uncharacterized protein